MAKKNRRQRPADSELLREPNGETRTAEVATIAWMLAVMTATVCEAAALVAAIVAGFHPEWTSLVALETVLVFSSLVIAVLSLVMGAVVRNLRREPVPPPVTVFALLVGIEPFVFILVLWARQWR